MHKNFYPMKTYKHLWDDFISRENFDLAVTKAVKSKKSKKSVAVFLQNKDENIEKLRSDLIYGKYKTSRYKMFMIYEPKQRVIYELPLYPDHIVHHAIINILGPIWQRLFIRDSYSCIPGRGLLSASRRTMEFIRKNKYVLQCDIRKFFPSINHEIMMKIIKRKISDKRLLKIIREIVFSVGGETNLPIGNLTSQWMGNVYLNELDYFVKHVLHWKCYIRYCDDFCLFGNDKSELRIASAKIRDFVENKLAMQFSKCILRQTKDGVSFIGYRHFKDFVLIRKDTRKKIQKRIMNIINHRDFDKKSMGQMAAAHGWLKWCNSHNFRKRMQTIAKEKSCGYFIKKHLL